MPPERCGRPVGTKAKRGPFQPFDFSGGGFDEIKVVPVILPFLPYDFVASPATNLLHVEPMTFFLPARFPVAVNFLFYGFFLCVDQNGFRAIVCL